MPREKISDTNGTTDMFAPVFNPGYGMLTHHAADYILKWTGHLFTEAEAETGPG